MKDKFKLTIRMFIIGILSSVLLIPTAFICSLSKERADRRTEVVSKIAQSWGDKQAFGGPVIESSERTIRPKELKMTADIKAEERHRGIFSIPFYTSQIEMKTSFETTKELRKANLVLSGLNKYSTDEVLVILNGKLVKSGWVDNDSPKRLRSHLGTLSAGKHDVLIRLKIRGTEAMHFLPSGDMNEIQFKSNWRHPNFSGAYSAQSVTINESGFVASYNIRVLADDSSALRELDGYNYTSYPSVETLDASFIGVNLYQPVDLYLQIERSVKYAVLFISLTFLTFFFFEVIVGLEIHPVQYLFVGLALCLFYLLLLSFAEHIGFAWAYLVAAIADIGMIGMYGISVLKSFRRSLLLTGILILLYGFLYTILQLELYSLLVGSIGLFVILGVVMYITRNINWYSKEA